MLESGRCCGDKRLGWGVSWSGWTSGVARATIDCFFFQAEDGIRYRNVTGVQTCALPILRGEFGNAHLNGHKEVLIQWQYCPRERVGGSDRGNYGPRRNSVAARLTPLTRRAILRSEERRVGKECRSRGARD